MRKEIQIQPKSILKEKKQEYRIVFESPKNHDSHQKPYQDKVLKEDNDS